MRGTRDLRLQDGGDVRRGHRVQRLFLTGARGVEDGAQGAPVRREFVEEPRDRVPVGHVAGRDGDFGAQLLQFGPQLGRAGSLRAATARQDEVLDAFAGQPARHVPADRTRTAGDQGSAARRPPGFRAAVVGQRGVREAAYEDAGVPHRELVLTRGPREGGGEAGAGTGVVRRRQVDQAAPAVRVLQGHDPAEAPQLRLVGADGPVAAAGGDGAVRHRPQPRADPGVAEGLHKRDGSGEPGGHGLVPVDGGLVETEERDDTGEFRAGVVAQPTGQRLAGHLMGGEPQFGDLRTGPCQGFGGACGPGVPCGAVGQHHEPPAGEPGRRQGAAGQGLPGHAVAQGVEGRPLAVLAPPRRQGGQDGAEAGGGVLRDLQFRRQLRQVLALHGFPEARLDLVHGDHGARARHFVLRQPVVLALEGIRGQVDDGSGAGVERLPASMGTSSQVPVRVENSGTSAACGVTPARASPI